jgi:hypothetical protein
MVGRINWRLDHSAFESQGGRDFGPAAREAEPQEQCVPRQEPGNERGEALEAGIGSIQGDGFELPHLVPRLLPGNALHRRLRRNATVRLIVTQVRLSQNASLTLRVI